MDEAIQVSCIIYKLPSSWKDFKHTLKHKEELTLFELGNHLRIEESLRVQASDKPKGSNVSSPSIVNMMKHNNSSMYNDNKSKRKHHDNIRADPNKKAKPTCWKCDKTVHIKRDCKGANVGNKANAYFVKDDDVALWVDSGAAINVYKDRSSHVHFKRMQDISKDGLIPAFDMDTEKWNKKYFVTFIAMLQGIECIFVGYAEHSKAFRFYVIKPNDSVSINSIIESMDAIFDENRFFLVPRPSHKISNRIEDIGGSVFPEEVTKEDDLKTFDEAMKSQDVALWKEAINDEMDSIMGNNTWVLADLPPRCRPLGCKWIFKRKLKVDLTKEFLSLRFSMKDMGEADIILDIRIIHEISTPMDTSEKMMPNNGQRVLKHLKKTMDYRLMDTSYPSLLERYTDASWISNTEDNSSTSGWVFLLGDGAISWASKKQTCITGSTIESEFVALVVAGKEAEWLRNLVLEITLWVKLIAPIFIHCDSAATLAKVYSQMYNGKS
ncbi:zinc finger, CCHC-type containing protein [Tanacetum coccineum]